MRSGGSGRNVMIQQKGSAKWEKRSRGQCRDESDSRSLSPLAISESIKYEKNRSSEE